MRDDILGTLRLAGRRPRVCTNAGGGVAGRRGASLRKRRTVRHRCPADVSLAARHGRLRRSLSACSLRCACAAPAMIPGGGAGVARVAVRITMSRWVLWRAWKVRWRKGSARLRLPTEQQIQPRFDRTRQSGGAPGLSAGVTAVVPLVVCTLTRSTDKTGTLGERFRSMLSRDSTVVLSTAMTANARGSSSTIETVARNLEIPKPCVSRGGILVIHMLSYQRTHAPILFAFDFNAHI